MTKSKRKVSFRPSLHPAPVNIQWMFVNLSSLKKNHYICYCTILPTLCVYRFLCFCWKNHPITRHHSPPSSPCRNEALLVRPFFPIRSDHRHCGFKDHENEGSGLCGVQRAGCCHKRSAAAAGFPLLQQTNGRKTKPWIVLLADKVSACCTGCLFPKRTLIDIQSSEHKF